MPEIDANHVRRFNTSVTIDGEKRYLEFFQATIGVGTQNWPCIHLVTHKAQDAETKMMALSSDDVAKEMAKRQETLFSPRNDEDVKITIKGDDNNNFSFEGFTSGPSYSFSAHNVELSDSVIPGYTKINFLNLSVYKDSVNTDEKFLLPSLESEGSVCKLTSAMVKKWMSEHAEIDPSTLNDQYINAQHEINKDVVDYWHTLLNNSNDTFGWDDLAEASGTIGDSYIKETLYSIMCQSAGVFSTAIDRFAEEFQCLYVPDWNDIGAFLNRQDMYRNPETLKVDPISLSFSAANGFGLMPTSYLGIENSDAYINTDDKGYSRFNNYICVPEENVDKGGQVIRMLGPSWLPPAIPMSPKEANSGKSRASVSPSISKAKGHIQKSEELQKKRDKEVHNYIKEWGLSAYTYLSLVDSNAEIYMPLNFNLQIGKRYEVVNREGKTLFKGFLYRLTHTLSTKSRSPMATTMANFSHIEIGDFELENVPH